MRTTSSMINWPAVCAAVLAMAAAGAARADQSAPGSAPEKQFTGLIVSVNAKDLRLKAKGFFLTRQFNLGTACRYVLLDKNTGAPADLRPGEKIQVAYQNVDGVLVADEVKQVPMRHTAMVRAIDPLARTLTLHEHGMNTTYQIANDCPVVLRDDKSGTLASIQTGNRVTVTYEEPDGKATARQIAQTSLEFSGSLTAIDLGEKTLKAKSLLVSKQFNVGNDCAIVINGKTDGRLSDLKLNDRLVFSYDEINGVNVVNRIALAGVSSSSPVSTTVAPMAPN
jgi:Cu/Ag efflux protein CusF